MKPRTLLGVLSVVAWIVAILTVVLPVVSVAIPGNLSVSSGRPAPSSGTFQINIPKSFDVTNHGFLPVTGVYLRVAGYYPNGTRFFSVTTGPVDLNPGSTVNMTLVTNLPTITPSDAAALSAFKTLNITATAGANLGGLIPISASAQFQVPVNGTGGAP